MKGSWELVRVFTASDNLRNHGIWKWVGILETWRGHWICGGRGELIRRGYSSCPIQTKCLPEETRPWRCCCTKTKRKEEEMEVTTGKGGWRKGKDVLKVPAQKITILSLWNFDQPLAMHDVRILWLWKIDVNTGKIIDMFPIFWPQNRGGRKREGSWNRDSHLLQITSGVTLLFFRHVCLTSWTRLVRRSTQWCVTTTWD